MTLEEMKKELEGTEILSLEFEGCVGIKDGFVIKAGLKIAKLNNKNASILLDEMFFNEFGTNDIDSVMSL